MDQKKASVSRRTFAGAAGAAAAGLMIVPRHVIAQSGQTPPSEKLNVACIGVGGRGWDNVRGISGSENIVALCDVDDRSMGRARAQFPEAKTYRDFRAMLDEMSDKIDAVSVGTPDHIHAVAAIAAIKRKKPVYCEKPLAHSIWEIRELMKAAKENNVITQLGNQGHSSGSIRQFCEYVWAGAIGNVHTVHARCNAANSRIRAISRMSESHAVPAELDWNLWLGPAKERPYNPMYLPGSWRSWSAFGSGTIGDWVCHVVDPSFWALDLGYPTSVQAEVIGFDPKIHYESFAPSARIRFEFPAREKRGPVTLFWYSGGWPIPDQPGLTPKDVPGTGAVVLGDEGGLVHGSHGGGGVRLFPRKIQDIVPKPEEKLPRVRGHYEDWLDSIRAGKPAGSDFSYGGPLSELARLGIIAEYFPNTRLEWNGEEGRFTNNEEADKYIKPNFREGWTL